MNNEFTQLRIRSILSKYEKTIEALIENEDDLTEIDIANEVRALIVDLESEKALAIKTQHDVFQETNFIPAIDEALNFLTQSLELSGTTRFESKLDDASFSLSYYKHH